WLIRAEAEQHLLDAALGVREDQRPPALRLEIVGLGPSRLPRRKRADHLIDGRSPAGGDRNGILGGIVIEENLGGIHAVGSLRLRQARAGLCLTVFLSPNPRFS